MGNHAVRRCCEEKPLPRIAKSLHPSGAADSNRATVGPTVFVAAVLSIAWKE